MLPKLKLLEKAAEAGASQQLENRESIERARLARVWSQIQKMARRQQAASVCSQPGNLRANRGPHMVEGENWFLQAVL